MIEIPEKFYESEERSGWHVWNNTKKVWSIELGLFDELERICKKHNIKYYAEGGTLLGAARHKGFIPWDDDMDFAMLRDDYNKFCEVAPTEVKSPFFFQDYKTDKVNILFCRLRNSNTTALPLRGIPYTDYTNHGIFIDIFPIDAVPDDTEEEDKVFTDIKNLKTVLKNAFDTSERETAIKNIEDYFNKLNKKDYKNLTIYGLSHSKAFVRPKSIYNDEPIELNFEMAKIPTMKDYKTALDWHYKDWENTYVIGGSQHMIKLFDVEKSYGEYRDEPPKE